MFGLCSHIRRVRLKAALHRMVSVRHQSTARVICFPMLSNGSRCTLISYGAFPLHGTVRYGSPLGGFPLGTVPGT